MTTITIHAPTHRDACINFGAGTAEDAQQYDQFANSFFAELTTRLAEVKVAVVIDLRGWYNDAASAGRSYSVDAADPDDEREAHSLMQQHGDFWAWYNNEAI